MTATQDMWHAGTDAVFERAAGIQGGTGGGSAGGGQAFAALAGDGQGFLAGSRMALGTAPDVPDEPAGRRSGPGLWVTAKAARLHHDDTVETEAFGRDYELGLGRELDVTVLQGGFDVDIRGVLHPTDSLVLGLLGGAVRGELEYDDVLREFDLAGWHAGAYASYLSGGFHFAALAKAELLKLDTETVGFPDELDSESYGGRVDVGYRFGAAHFYLQPIATIAAVWSRMDGFSNGTNTVDFEDGSSVRGRLGLRVGTTLHPLLGVALEPFLEASLWSELDGDNRASLVSDGEPFAFTDSPDDVWGVVSAGLVMSGSSGTSAFAKADLTFGEEIDGVAGELGVRFSW